MRLDLTEGSPFKLIFKFSLPILIGNIFQQLYNMADTIIVGHTISSDAMSGVGCTAVSYTHLKASAFSGCPKIESVSIPSTMNFTKLDSQSGQYFKDCSSLTSVTFPAQSSVTHIYRETFSGTKLSGALILPDSVQEISVSAFPSTLNCLYPVSYTHLGYNL